MAASLPLDANFTVGEASSLPVESHLTVGEASSLPLDAHFTVGEHPPFEQAFMAGRRRKRARSLAGTSRTNNRVSTHPADQQVSTEPLAEQQQTSNVPTEQEQEYDLPTEVLELIFSQLSLKDNIRASRVCKRWLAVAISVRKANRPPWLMQFPKSGYLYEFYDPETRQSYYLKLPKLQGVEICHARDGWLLCFKPRTRRVFLFHPYTQEQIKFPKLLISFSVLSFSAPPSSPSCVLFTVNPWTMSIVVSISTCRPGDTEWTTVQYPSQPSYVCSIWNKAIFCKGLFYCMSITGAMGIYDQEQHAWTILPFYLPMCTDLFQDSWWKRRVMAEHDGAIYVVYPRPLGLTEMYKLELRVFSWEKVEVLDGVSFFANFISSQVRTDLLGKMTNQIFFPKVVYYGKRCITYSLNERRYYPRLNGFNLDELEYFENVWLDAPEDLSIFL